MIDRRSFAVALAAGVTRPEVLAQTFPSRPITLIAPLGARRGAAFPDVPTLRESGVKIVNESPFGIGVPRGTDPAVIQRLHDAFRASLDEPAVQAAYARFMLPPAQAPVESALAAPTHRRSGRSAGAVRRPRHHRGRQGNAGRRCRNGKKIRAEAASVAVTDRGYINVDKLMRTNVAHFFAIGDVR